jgi:peroxiredoxin
MRTIPAVLIQVVAVTLLLVLPSRGHAGPAAAQPPHHGSLPEFSLDAAGGGALSVRREHGHLHITNGKVSTPRVLVVHFFQPDCLQCQSEAKALQAIHQKLEGKGVRVIGIAHREDAQAARAFAQRLGVSYPLLLGTGSQVSRQLAAGDSLYITDDRGAIRFSQPGYGTGDEALWNRNIDLLLAGKPVASATTEREKLSVGDRLPTVKLKSLMTGEEMSLTGKDGRLTFTDTGGKSVRPRAAIGLFARYCAFTREEMVHLQRLHERYGKDGLLVFTIALHPNPEAAKAVTRELGLTYPVFEGHGSDLEKQYGFG